MSREFLSRARCGSHLIMVLLWPRFPQITLLVSNVSQCHWIVRTTYSIERIPRMINQSPRMINESWSQGPCKNGRFRIKECWSKPTNFWRLHRSLTGSLLFAGLDECLSSPVRCSDAQNHDIKHPFLIGNPRFQGTSPLFPYSKPIQSLFL